MKITIKGKQGEGKSRVARRIMQMLNTESSFAVTLHDDDSQIVAPHALAKGECTIKVKQNDAEKEK